MGIPISNPIVTSGSFNTWWISNLSYTNTTSGSSQMLVQFVPYNGQYVLGVKSNNMILDVIDQSTSNPSFGTMISALQTEVLRQYSINNNNASTAGITIQVVNINAKDPSKKINANVLFSNNGNPLTYSIRDMFTLAGEDPTFGAVLMNIMSTLGTTGYANGTIY